MSAMSDFYVRVAEQSGLDPDSEETLDTVAAAMESAPEGLCAVDLFDHVVDSIIFAPQ